MGVCVWGAGAVQKERPITCIDVMIRKRTMLVVHWNAVPCRYLQQEQGCGAAGMCKLKTHCKEKDMERAPSEKVSISVGQTCRVQTQQCFILNY